MYIHFGIMFWY